MKILIIGCGITGSSLSNFIKKFQTSSKSFHEIYMFDKARGCGGRMSTKRYNDSGETLTVDLGAQYFSVENLKSYEKIIEELEESKLIYKINNSLIKNIPHIHQKMYNYAPLSGSNSVVKYFLNGQGNISYNTTINSIKLDGSKCIARYSQNNVEAEEIFDCIIFTHPVSQILQLNGIHECENKSALEQLKSVKYSNRFALGLFFDGDTDWIDDMPVMEYIEADKSDTIAYISVDSRKQLKKTKWTSICVHSRAYPFGSENIDKSIEEVQPILLDALYKLYPLMRQHKHVICHKWRYSQVHRGYQSNQGCVVLNKEPLIIAGGDAFSGSSGLFHCIDSSRSIMQHLENIL